MGPRLRHRTHRTPRRIKGVILITMLIVMLNPIRTVAEEVGPYHPRQFVKQSIANIVVQVMEGCITVSAVSRMQLEQLPVLSAARLSVLVLQSIKWKLSFEAFSDWYQLSSKATWC